MPENMGVVAQRQTKLHKVKGETQKSSQCFSV